MNDDSAIEIEEPTVRAETDNSSRRRTGAILGIATFIGIIVIVIIVTFLTIKSPEKDEEPVVKIPSSRKLDCLPRIRTSSSASDKKLCEEKNCVYSPKNATDGSPVCFYDTDKLKFRLAREEATNLGRNYFIENVADKYTVKVEFEFLEETVFRFKLSKVLDSGKHYEVPIPVRKVNDKAETTVYDVQISKNKNDWHFKIIRKSTEQVIWDTSIGGLIFGKNFIQIATLLPSQNVYGFGENKHTQFRHDTKFRSWPLFSRDQPPGRQDEANLYGVQPFYTCVEKDGNTHGVLLINSNAMEYEFIPEPALVYRTSGGVLDFYTFLGPHPETVIQQYTKFIGRPFMPPYWALGFQVSRYGYTDLNDMKKVLDRFKKYDIPLDTQVADIDHMDERKIFTIDQNKWKGIEKYFEELIAGGMKTIILFDPFVAVNETNYEPFNRGKEKGVFITWPNGVTNPDYQYTNSSIMVGYCWPKGRVAYPDFFKKSTQEWWKDEVLRHRKKIIFNGLWIDMNEPAVFGTNTERAFNWPVEDTPYWTLKCPDDEYEFVDMKASHMYKDNKKLSDSTLCMSAVQGENNQYKHFDVHSLYGYTHAIPSYEVAQLLDKEAIDGVNKRSLVITRSNYIGTGQYAGHWTGDNDSKWSHLYYSIIGMLEFNLFGIPYVGADICGFFENTTEQLCQRWQQVGAFYPFSRNHNGELNEPQDPGYFSAEVALSSKRALDIRYEMLPYYYTLFFKAHTKGNTVIRPLFHEYPEDANTYPIDRQFLIGPAVLVTPVLDENKVTVNGYFPKDNWYSYYDGAVVRNASGAIINGATKELDAPFTFIPIHIRGGHIVPTQKPANNTVYSRRQPFGLIVALDWDGEAKGDLFYDDGETYKYESGEYFYATFTVKSSTLKMNIEQNNYDRIGGAKLDTIRILVETSVKPTFVLNGQTVLQDNKVEHQKTQIILKNLDLPMSQPFEITWKDNTLSVNAETRIDCSIEDSSITETKCVNRRCAFDAQANGRVPKCYIPKDIGGYTLKNTNGNRYELQRADDFSIYGDEISDPVIQATTGTIDGKFNVIRIKISDSKKARYEVPIAVNMIEGANQMTVSVQNSQNTNKAAYFEVKSKDGVTLIDNKNLQHGFIYSNQFIQLALNMGYKNVYGFGENSHYSFQHKFEYSNFWGVFGRDQPTGGEFINLYGSQPFLMAVHENGRAMGLLILNSNAMEYGFLPPRVFSYRTLGGVLDMFVLEEESPERLIQAYTSLIGKPYMPPYWSLGFQLCRYGYNSLKNLKAAVDRTVAAGIPLDIQYADIDHFDTQLDFTYDKENFNGLPAYIRELNSTGIRFIIILDPAINSGAKDYPVFDRGTKDDIWIKWPSLDNPQKDEIEGNNQYMLGYVWPVGKAVFPDFFLERTKTWWKNEIVQHYNNVLQFDGLWIDMNEPANFDTNFEKPWNYPANLPPWNLKCPTNTKLDNPAYLPLIAKPFGEARLISDKTICMVAKQGETSQYDHYDVHNLYGLSQSQPTLDALRAATDKRGIVISRSTYVSSGKYAGHWLGDNTSKWKDLKLNIIGMLEFNLFGIPYIGADICGFFGETTPELCQRWTQIGAFNTFYRNHNGFGTTEQDPAALGPNVASSSKKVTEIRYSLLPYLYTLFYNVNQNGGTVIRSLVHEFPADKRTAEIDQQFMWGSSLLISPVVNPNTRSIFAYFPKARWFDFYTGSEIPTTGRTHEIDAPLDHLPLHIRGDSILITQEPANNTRYSRMNAFGLIVAPGDQNKASGQLYWDGGEEIDPTATSSIIDFEMNQNEIKSTIRKNNYQFESSNILNTARIFGQQRAPTRVLVNNQAREFKYNSETKELKLNNLSLKVDTPFTIRIE